MKFTVVGTGAIGGVAGAYLARAGEDVEFVDTNYEHVEAMQRNGLTVESTDGTFCIPVTARHPTEISRPLEVVLLAVKAHHTEPAVRSLLTAVGPGTAIVSLQNGLCEPLIGALVGPERTIGAFVNYGGDYISPGVIRFAGHGAFFIGEMDGRVSPRVEEIVRRLQVWGDVRATDNIRGYLWTKMTYMDMLYSTALVDESIADVFDQRRELVVEIACEMAEVADRQAVHMESFDKVEPYLYYPRHRQNWEAINRSLDEYVARMRGRPRQRTGIWRDLVVHKRKTEVDYHLALAVAIGSSFGLEMPLTRQIIRMIHELEDGVREMGWANIEVLEALRQPAAV